MGEVQIPLWETDLFKINDHVISSRCCSEDSLQSCFQWEELHKLSGKVGQPVLHRQAPPQRRKSSSSSSSDGEIDTRHNLSLKELNNLLLSYIDQV